MKDREPLLKLYREDVNDSKIFEVIAMCKRVLEEMKKIEGAQQTRMLEDLVFQRVESAEKALEKTKRYIVEGTFQFPPAIADDPVKCYEQIKSDIVFISMWSPIHSVTQAAVTFRDIYDRTCKSKKIPNVFLSED